MKVFTAFTNTTHGDMRDIDQASLFLSQNNMSHYHPVFMNQVHGNNVSIVDEIMLPKNVTL